MKEILDSVKDGLKGRLTNPAYGSYIIFWVILHWQFIFSVFSLDQNIVLQKTGLLKNEYLSQTFFNFHDWYFYFSWLFPFILTWFVIWILPDLILLPAFEKDQEYELAKKKIRIIQEREVENEQTKLEQQNVKKLEAVVEKVTKEKEIKEIDPSLQWEEEYEEFKRTSFYNRFNLIITSIYDRYGAIYWNNNSDGSIPRDMLAYLDTHELATINREERNISLTEKGKFFVKKFTGEFDKLTEV
jgi:hypothetical protein